jgi:thioredoxin-like negative regulator of GroEL
MIHEITGEEDTVRLQANGPLMVKFDAPWCGACKQLNPIFHELAFEFKGRMEFATCNTDEVCAEWVGGLAIGSLPTVIIFNGQADVWRMVGACRKETYAAAIKDWIG